MNLGALGSILAGGTGMTVVLGIYDRVRNRKFDRRKQTTSIKLDEATYTEIAARAEQTNSSNLMAVGAFWQGQFTELSRNFASEQEWRRKMTERLREHVKWDEMLIRHLDEHGMHVDPPPSLSPDV